MKHLKSRQRRAALHGLSPFAEALEHSLIGIGHRALLADFPFNEGLGRAVQFYLNVDGNSPANSALILLIINANGDTDATMRDRNDIAALLAGTANEVTNTNYARKVLTDSDLSAFTVDDANDRADLDIPDQSFTAIGAGDPWTDAVMAYDPDTTTGTDSTLVPISCHDFPITPDGSDINLVVAAAGFYRAAAA